MDWRSSAERFIWKIPDVPDNFAGLKWWGECLHKMCITENSKIRFAGRSVWYSVLDWWVFGEVLLWYGIFICTELMGNGSLAEIVIKIFHILNIQFLEIIF